MTKATLTDPPLLMVVDLQKGWRHATATEAAMLRTVELCRAFKGDVIHCRFKNDPASLFHTQLNWRRLVQPPDIDEIPEIAALQLPTYWRTTYSCVTEELLPVITRHSKVYIAGVFTDISVHATALALFDRDISAYVVRDCVATLHGEAVHKAALASLEHAIGRAYVADMASVLAGA